MCVCYGVTPVSCWLASVDLTLLLCCANSRCSHTGLSPVHTGDYSRRFRPFLATVAEFGDYSRQCGQAIIKTERLYRERRTVQTSESVYSVLLAIVTDIRILVFSSSCFCDS